MIYSIYWYCTYHCFNGSIPYLPTGQWDSIWQTKQPLESCEPDHLTLGPNPGGPTTTTKSKSKWSLRTLIYLRTTKKWQISSSFCTTDRKKLITPLWPPNSVFQESVFSFHPIDTLFSLSGSFGWCCSFRLSHTAQYHKQLVNSESKWGMKALWLVFEPLENEIMDPVVN